MALMKLRQQVSDNELGVNQFRQSLRCSDFGNDIPHWNEHNPLNQNYASFIDFVKNPKIIASRMGFCKHHFLLLKAAKLLVGVKKRQSFF